MQVLDTEDRRPVGSRQLVEQRAEDPLTGCVLVAGLAKSAADLARDGVHRTERRRCARTFAGAPQPPRIRLLLVQRFEECGLADAGLTGNEYGAPVAAARVVGVLGQGGQDGIAFEKTHPRMVADR